MLTPQTVKLKTMTLANKSFTEVLYLVILSLYVLLSQTISLPFNVNGSFYDKLLEEKHFSC